MSAALPLSIAVDASQAVSALLNLPVDPRAACTLAHGAGAGMNHPFMSAVASGLAERGIATLRFQFPFMERGSKRVDPPASRKRACALRRRALANACPACRSLPAASRSAAA